MYGEIYGKMFGGLIEGIGRMLLVMALLLVLLPALAGWFAYKKGFERGRASVPETNLAVACASAGGEIRNKECVKVVPISLPH